MKKLRNLYWDLLDFLEDRGYNKSWLAAAFISVLSLIVLIEVL